jgi:hypothetical protein
MKNMKESITIVTCTESGKSSSCPGKVGDSSNKFGVGITTRRAPARLWSYGERMAGCASQQQVEGMEARQKKEKNQKKTSPAMISLSALAPRRSPATGSSSPPRRSPSATLHGMTSSSLSSPSSHSLPSTSRSHSPAGLPPPPLNAASLWPPPLIAAPHRPAELPSSGGALLYSLLLVVAVRAPTLPASAVHCASRLAFTPPHG